MYAAEHAELVNEGRGVWQIWNLSSRKVARGRR
jgi:hypothetical protein